MSPSSAAEYYYNRIDEAHLKANSLHAIRDFRVILDLLFKQLTEGEKRSFSGLKGRMEFVFDRDQTPIILRGQIRSLHKLAKLISNEHRDPSPEEYLLALKTICLTVEDFLALRVPERLSNIYICLGKRLFTSQRAAIKGTAPLLKLLIIEVGGLVDNPGDKPYFRLHCRDDEEDIELQVCNTDFNELVLLQPLLRPFQSLQVSHCRQSELSPHHFSTTAQSQLVLEPDLLIDISDLAECFTRKGSVPMIALLRKLLPQDSSVSAFKGNVINALFDDIIRTQTKEYSVAFREAAAENLLQAVAIGREGLNQIYSSIRKEHLHNIMTAAETVRDRPVRIEPTFLSDQYGLQGRLDLMAEDDEDALRKDIFELKSGKAPGYGTWMNNQMQVVGYNLLLKSCFGPQRKGSSAIIYSSATTEPLRDVTNSPILENCLLLVRNIHVAHLLLLAAGEMDVLGEIKPDLGTGLATYQLNDFTRFHTAYQQASSFTLAYYHRFLSFILREYLSAKCGFYSAPQGEYDSDGFAALWRHEEEEKLNDGTILRGLKFCWFEENENRVHFELKQSGVDEISPHNFRQADVVIVYGKDCYSAKSSPLRQQIQKARIDEISDQAVVISLNNHQIDASYFKNYEEWVLEHDLYEGNYWQSTRALFRVLEPENAERFFLLNGFSEHKSNYGWHIEQTKLNQNQRCLIQDALNAEGYYLVQGPPGTGKTSIFLTHFTRELLRQKGSVVIVAFTNRAVDEIGQRLEIAGVSHMRLGSRQTATEAELRNLVKEKEIALAAQMISSHRVFISTVATINSRLDALQKLKSDLHTLIIDEASQLTEPAIIGLVLSFRKCILIGDQNQLPPVVTQASIFCEIDESELVKVGIKYLNASLFERMIYREQHKGMRDRQSKDYGRSWGILNTHYRMHEDIAALINPWYANQLNCGLSKQKQPHAFLGPLDSTWHGVLNTGRVIFIPSPREMTTKEHRTEADRVRQLVLYIRESMGDSFKSESVGVVTPWRKQVVAIRRLLKDDKQLIQSLNIDTVERFQGSENEIIIVSMAVYHPAQLEWLTSPGRFPYQDDSGMEHTVSLDRKLLVTISRAKQQIILLGDPIVLSKDPLYSEILGKMKWVRLS